MISLCERCGGEMGPGIALVSTIVCASDDLGGEALSVCAGGPGRLVECLKCGECGLSVRAAADGIPDSDTTVLGDGKPLTMREREGAAEVAECDALQPATENLADEAIARLECSDVLARRRNVNGSEMFGSAAEETVERTIWVGVTAPGFTGRFVIPDKYLHELTAWLAQRAGGREKQPNARISNDAP